MKGFREYCSGLSKASLDEWRTYALCVLALTWDRAVPSVDVLLFSKVFYRATFLSQHGVAD